MNDCSHLASAIVPLSPQYLHYESSDAYSSHGSIDSLVQLVPLTKDSTFDVAGQIPVPDISYLFSGMMGMYP